MIIFRAMKRRMVIDARTGKTIADIPGQKIAHGVAVVPEAGRGFISDGGRTGAIVIFDLKTNGVLGSIVSQPETMKSFMIRLAAGSVRYRATRDY
jgi:hypothetical protein